MKQHPKQVVLVGCEDALAARLRQELDGLEVGLAGEFPGTQAAINNLLLTLSESRIFVFQVRTTDDLRPLRRLSEIFSGHPIVALVEGAQDAALLVGANRMGAAQVVPLPFRADDFRAAIRRIEIQFGGAITDSEVIAVAGVTGGCGATSIATNLAFEVAHRRKEHSILVELSFQLGKLANYFDIEPEYTIQDLFKNIDNLDADEVGRVLTRIDEYFSVIVGPYKNLAGIAPTPNDVRRLIHHTKRLARHVILDVPCTLDEHYFEILTAADRIILITEQKIPSLRSLKLVCDALDKMEPARPRILVVNRYQPKVPGFSVKKLEEVLKTTGLQTIGNDFAAMNATLDHGRPLRLEAPKSRVLADIVALSRVLFGGGGDEPAPAPRGSLVSTLSRLGLC